ncbi:Uma2 family endonuclease [Aquisphaera insulae]|uniref:Uma2 family endonuclease n=1 Tax=Aquisphaera insulae TaxID=2712864 RepID=UPI0013ED0187|nr:Uma2 family endonuclease [Aquisphaera insulae]
MATVIESGPSQAATADAPFPLTVDVFARMVESGLIPRDRRVYLRGGRLFEKMGRTRAHGYVGAAITRAITRRLPDGWSLRPESTIEIDPSDAPLPDFSIIRGANPLDFGPPDRYPRPADVGLLIEVAVTSLRDDLTSALELYARASIPVYWVVDVPSKRLLVHTEPRIIEGRGTYSRVETIRGGESAPLVLDGQEVARIPFDEILR